MRSLPLCKAHDKMTDLWTQIAVPSVAYSKNVSLKSLAVCVIEERLLNIQCVRRLLSLHCRVKKFWKKYYPIWLRNVSRRDAVQRTTTSLPLEVQHRRLEVLIMYGFKRRVDRFCEQNIKLHEGVSPLKRSIRWRSVEQPSITVKKEKWEGFLQPAINNRRIFQRPIYRLCWMNTDMAKLMLCDIVQNRVWHRIKNPSTCKCSTFLWIIFSHSSGLVCSLERNLNVIKGNFKLPNSTVRLLCNVVHCSDCIPTYHGSSERWRRCRQPHNIP